MHPADAHPTPGAAADPEPADGQGPGAPEPWRTFGACLRYWRRRAGLTQTQLGARIGYDHSAVSRLEHGSRRPSPRLADHLDELLGAGGELRAADRTAEATDAAGHHQPSDPGPHQPLRPPLPAGPAGFAVPGPPGIPDRAPARLPDYGTLCPVHDAAGCTLPPPAEIARLHAAYCDHDPATAPPLDTATAHALAAVLVAHLRTAEDHPAATAAHLLERTLDAILRRPPAAPARRRATVRLAAEYAHAAGVLRMQLGRNATAMACLDRALSYGELAADPATTVAALSDMSILARLDGDTRAAHAYARAINLAAPGRHWAGAMAQTARARAAAQETDPRATVRHIARARLHLDHIDPRDEDDAPWLGIASMHLRVESAAAAALRDLAAHTGDPQLARRAVTACTTALELQRTPGPSTTRLLLTVRLADAHLCAHDPHAALALLTPALTAAPGTLPALVTHELRGLHHRLTGGRAHHPPLADTAALAATHLR